MPKVKKKAKGKAKPIAKPTVRRKLTKPPAKKFTPKAMIVTSKTIKNTPGMPLTAKAYVKKPTKLPAKAKKPAKAKAPAKAKKPAKAKETVVEQESANPSRALLKELTDSHPLWVRERLPNKYELILPKGNVPASLQQCTLFDWINWGEGNAFVEAVAGSGKTTSLTQGCRFMNGSVMLTCFNKKIAIDIGTKLEQLKLANVRASTFHSIGWQACIRAYKGVKLDARGKRDAMFEHLRVEAGLMEFPVKLRSIVGSLVSLAKQKGVFKFADPDEIPFWLDIVEHHNLDDDIEDPAMVMQAVEFAISGIKWSKEIAPKLMDFDDQIWMPIITNMQVPKFDWVLVDEAQDTNAARRALAHKMMHERSRIVFVGDRNQAIYGFCGADSDAIDILMKDFNCIALPLNVTYRCPQAVVREAQKYVSHIVAWDQAAIGSVASVNATEFWDNEVAKLYPECAILCRNTKPLVALAFQLIRRNVACHVEGRDIGQGLLKLTQRWKVTEIGELHDKLEEYLERERAKLDLAHKEAQSAALQDRVETLYILMEGCTTVSQLAAKIDNLFKDTEGSQKRTVTLSTVHKAKGREWDYVYILGFDKYMPSKWAKQSWEKEQETNIIYVAITRAIKQLTFTEHLEDKKA